ncbi:MAG: NADH-quinone oxidoreductase subunit J [Thermodesulfobacteriota bacterium]|nr:NADH-quinone oxidoreductase subunit J [Thermodesulfobacteriota bacterium]
MIVYEYVAEALFYVFMILTFMGAFIAVRSKMLMHAVLGLAVSLFGVAGLYFHLGSPFLAVMQILIYVGAVCIMIVMGVMLGNTPDQLAFKNLKGRNMLLAIVACSAGFFSLFAAITRTKFAPVAETVGDMSIRFIGENLLFKYCLAFELISVVLLTAIIGAIILARDGREEEAS